MGQDRAISAKWNFDWKRPLPGLAKYIAPRASDLIDAVHPILTSVVDCFTQPLSQEERRTRIAGRKRSYWGPASRPDRDTIRQYTRSIPPSWRDEIISGFGGKCASCGTLLVNGTPHLDHLLPFSKGGKTTKENLQPEAQSARTSWRGQKKVFPQKLARRTSRMRCKRQDA